MDSVKTDNEGELTSTMGNVLSVSNKDEKNDTNDATPTSSTDANTTTTSPRIVSDDPISSTSSDIENKLRNTESNLQQSVKVTEGTSRVRDKCNSGDPEADLEINISNVSSEKITEDVEDLVHDLESLLGESTDSFNIPIKRKEERKSIEEEKTEPTKILDGDQETLSTGEPLSTQPNEKDTHNDVKEIGDGTNETTLEEVQGVEIQECNIGQTSNKSIQSDENEESIQTSETNMDIKESVSITPVDITSISPAEPRSILESTSAIEVKDTEEAKLVNDSVNVIIENTEPKEIIESATENIEETQQAQVSEQITLTDKTVAKENTANTEDETECTKEIIKESQTEAVVQDAVSLNENVKDDNEDGTECTKEILKEPQMEAEVQDAGGLNDNIEDHNKDGTECAKEFVEEPLAEGVVQYEGSLNESITDNNEDGTECVKEIVLELETETVVQDVGSITTNTVTEVSASENERPEYSAVDKECVMTESKNEVAESTSDISEDHNLQEVANKGLEEETTDVSEKESILGDIKTETTGYVDDKMESIDTISRDDKETKIEDLAEPLVESLPAEDDSAIDNQNIKMIEKENVDMEEIKPAEPNSSCVENSVDTTLTSKIISEDVVISIPEIKKIIIPEEVTTNVPESNELSPKASDTEQSKQQCEVEDDTVAGTKDPKLEDVTPSNAARPEQNTYADIAFVIQDIEKKSEEMVNDVDAHEKEDVFNTTQEVESQLNIPKSTVDIVQDNIDINPENLELPNKVSANVNPKTVSSISELEDETPSLPSSDILTINPKSPMQLDTVQSSVLMNASTSETSTDLVESAVCDEGSEIIEATSSIKNVEDIQDSHPTYKEVETLEQDNAPATEVPEVISEATDIVKTVSEEVEESVTTTDNKVEDIEIKSSDISVETIHLESKEVLAEVTKEDAQPLAPSENLDLSEQQSKNIMDVKEIQTPKELTNEKGLPEVIEPYDKIGSVITPAIAEKGDIGQIEDVNDNITQALEPENQSAIPESSTCSNSSDIITSSNEQTQKETSVVPTSSNESIIEIDKSTEIETHETVGAADSDATLPNKTIEPNDITVETAQPIPEPEEIVCVQNESDDVVEQKEITPETEPVSGSFQNENTVETNASTSHNEVGSSEDLVISSQSISSCKQYKDSDNAIGIVGSTECDAIQILSPSAESDYEEIVPVLALEPDETNSTPKDSLVGGCTETEELSVVTEQLPQVADLEQVEPDSGLQENIDTIKAVEPEISEKERGEMEALRKAVESITDVSQSDYVENTTDIIEIGDDVPMKSTIVEVETVETKDFVQETQTLNIVEEKVVIEENQTISLKEDKIEVELKIEESIQIKLAVENQTISVKEDESDRNNEEVELKIEESLENSTEDCAIDNATENSELQTEDDIEERQHILPTSATPTDVDAEPKQEQLVNALPDSSQVPSITEIKQPNVPKEKDTKLKTNERSRRHKKSSADAKLEELSINVDVPDKEKLYSPKVIIKPIKVPDEEVSTTSNSDTEIGKGSLRMTITKQSDKMHSILKICDPEQCAEPVQEQDEPIPKLIIKPKMQQIEQHSPKMSTRSGKQIYSPTSSSQRSGSPRITIKPVVKPDKIEPVSPLKIKIKPEESSKKHSPKLNIKPVKPEEDVPQENIQSPRKVTIKPIVKPVEVEQVHSPRITIKPIPKPDVEKESMPPTPRLNIKIKKQEDDVEEIVDRERSSPKITIKPVVKPQEPDTQSGELEEEVKERIVLKINKGNLPTPVKESRKREHSAEEDKSEKLAKITVKFSKGGGHPHIVQQTEESNKRTHEEPTFQERSKKQKTDPESPISTRSKHKQEAVTESSVETRSKLYKDVTAENSKSESIKSKQKDTEISVIKSKQKDTELSVIKSKQKDTEVSVIKSKQKDTEVSIHESLRSKHQHQTADSPIEPKRAKLKDSTSEVTECDSGRFRARETSEPLQTAIKSRFKDHIRSEKSEERDTDDVTVVETKLDSPIVISEDSRSQDSGSCVIVEDMKDPLSDIPVFEINLQPLPLEKNVEPIVQKTETATPPAVATPPPRKRGRPRKVILTPQQKLEQSQVIAQQTQQQLPKDREPQPVPESGRPKRSCRGQSARATLGIKPRKPRGPGRGRGSKRGMGDRSVPMKAGREPKLSKAKLKLMQASLKQQISYPVAPAEADIEKKEFTVFPAQLEIKAPAPVLPPPDIPIEVPVSPSPVLHVPSPQAYVPSPAQQPVASPKSTNLPETSLTVESVSSIPSTSRADSTEIVMVDEETRMSADTSSRAQTPAKQIPVDGVVEESQSSVQSTATTESGKAPKPNKTPRLEVQDPEGAVISADQLTEYYWNGNGPFMLQEQVAQFLGIKSFKRKYPGIMRRMLEMQERDFIRESGLASEHMCDLGLTAVNSADILDIMYSDFQDKYEEYCKHQRDRQAKELINKQRALSLAASQEKNKADITEQAVQSAAQWNASFNKVRKEQRKACMDLQTLTVHYPKGKMKQINKPKVGDFPIALVPGQFTDYYKEFTPTEINNLPINTMCYDPINFIGPEESDESGSDGSESDSDSSSSSSGSGSDSSSGVEDCKLCKHTPRKGAPSK